MRRGGWLLGAVAVALVGLAVSGCSRPGGDGTGSSAAPTAPGVPLSAPSLTPDAPSATPSGGPLLTPEDAEDDAEHRITEQNLESELDRLEREIQAE